MLPPVLKGTIHELLEAQQPSTLFTQRDEQGGDQAPGSGV